MAIPIYIKRGLEAGIPVGADGEPLWTTDTHKLFVGQGGANYQIGGGGVSLTSGSVQSGHLGNASVVSGSVASGQLSTFHVASGGLGSGAIGSGQIGWPHLASGSVLSGAVASGQIGVNHLASGLSLVASGGVLSGSIGSGSIGWPHLSSGAVRSGHLGDGSTVSGSVASGALGNVHVGSGGWGSGAIGSGQIGWPHLSSGAVQSGHIASGQIGGNHLGSGLALVSSGSVGSGNVGSGQIAWPHLASGAFRSGHAGNNSIVSGSVASGQLAWPHLASGAIRSGHLGDGSTVSGSVASGQIGWPHLASGAIRSGHAGDGSIVSGSIASGQIGANHLASGIAFLASGSVLSGHVASGQIGWPHLASGAIRSGHLGDGSTVSGSVASGAIGWPHLAALTGLTAADVALNDEVPIYDTSATANRKVAVDRLLGFGSPGICEGRLTLTAGVPVTTADVLDTTMMYVYFTPYMGNRICLYDGTRWELYTFTELTHGINVATADLPYDIFIYDNAGTLALEFAAWTSKTARATALVTQDGVLCKTGALTRRYLGTFHAVGTTGTEDSAARRYLWNYYNRAQRNLYVAEATASWTYNSATWRSANASTANRVQVVIGVAEILVHLEVSLQMLTAATNRGCCGIAEDATNTNHAGITTPAAYAGAANYLPIYAILEKYPAVGYHYYQWTEEAGAGACTFCGTAGVLRVSAMGGYVWG